MIEIKRNVIVVKDKKAAAQVKPTTDTAAPSTLPSKSLPEPQIKQSERQEPNTVKQPTEKAVAPAAPNAEEATAVNEKGKTDNDVESVKGSGESAVEKDGKVTDKVKAEEIENMHEIHAKSNSTLSSCETLSEDSTQSGEAAQQVETAENQSKQRKSVVGFSTGVDYEGTQFYQAVKPQLDEMFVRYPAAADLNERLPGSKWLRVDLPDDYYVVGLLPNDDGKVQYVCYGIHGTHECLPPGEIEDMCQWLPLSQDEPHGEGYWIILQDASSGKCVKSDEL